MKKILKQAERARYHEHFQPFLGRSDSVSAITRVASKDARNKLSLTVLFSDALAVDFGTPGQKLRNDHPSLRQARVELAPAMSGALPGLAGWDKHVVQLVGFDAPHPGESLARCVAPAHYSQEIKARVRNNHSHVIIYYAGYEEDPLECYVALAAVAGALANENQGVVILSEHAHTSLPAGIFYHDELGDESLDFLHTLPLTMLYCGFVKYEVEGVSGVGMRTYGGDAFNIPDFAVRADGHHQDEQYSSMFGNIMNYLLENRPMMEAGHTMQVGESTYAKLRAPLPDEYFVQGPGKVLVAEIISAFEVNRD